MCPQPPNKAAPAFEFHISKNVVREFFDKGAAAARDQVEEESPGAAACTTTTTAMTSGEEEDAVAAAVAAVSPGRPMEEEGPNAAADERQDAAAVVATAEVFQWTPPLVVYAMTIFILTGCAEIMGGWLVYTAVRDNDDNADERRQRQRQRWWMIPLGSLILILYGFLPTFQPSATVDSFGRLYAVYGGFFIVMSFMAGWYLDGDRPDRGDVVGGGVALVGVLVVLFWPR